MRTRNRIQLLAGALAVALSALPAAGIAQSPSTAPAASVNPADAACAGKRLGFMIWNTSVPFYTNLIKGAEDQAAALGMDIDIRSGNGELTGQVATVQQFITEGFDMILVAPSDPQGIVPVIQEANAANIPVLAVNTKVGDGGTVVTYVGVDDFVFGQNQGELLKLALPDGGTVAYINGHLGVSAQIDRRAGLMDALGGDAKYQFVEEQTAEWDNAKALALVQDWLNKYPAGELDAIVDQGPEGATAAKYVMDSGRTEIKFIVGDFPADVKAGVADGSIFGTTDQDPYPQGVNGVQVACWYLSGQTDKIVAPNMYLDLPIITIENVDQYPAAWG
ncbi:MAG: sugar ABC transporter substrate-binding protein [Chloroflexota bacterium]